MQKIISEETITLIEDMYRQKLTMGEIARRTSVSYFEVSVRTRLREQGFNSYPEYRRYLAKKRQERKSNIKVAKIIGDGLERKNKNQSWLALELGVTRQTVSYWRNGESLPRIKKLENLFNVLDVNARDIGVLEDLLSE